MQVHADAHARHGQLAHASLEEGAREVVFSQGLSLLQEAVGLVAVRQVCRGAYHVGHLLGQCSEAGSRGCARGRAFLLHHRAPVYFGRVAAEPFLHQCRLAGVGLGPIPLFGAAYCHDFPQLFGAAYVKLVHLGEYLEGVLGVSAEVLHGVYVSVSAQRRPVGLYAVLVARAVVLACALAHHGLSYDEGGAALLLVGYGEGGAYLVGVVAVNLQHVPAPGLVFSLGVFVHHLAALG